MLVESVLKAKGNAVVTIAAETTVGEAAKLLAAKRIGALVVMDGDRLAGILSERDIVRGMAENGETIYRMPVSVLMSREVLVCGPADSVESLMATMTHRRVRHLPVLVDDRLVGIVTIGDVVKTRLDEATMEVDSLRSYVMGGR